MTKIKIKRVLVKQSCIDEGHACATCYERSRNVFRHSRSKYTGLIVRYLKKHERATKKDIMEVFDLSEQVVNYLLESAIKEGLIEKEEVNHDG